jgi:WNK lysine deficient protein kinase
MDKYNLPSPIDQSPGGRYICYHDILGRGAFKIVYRGYDKQEGIEVAWNSIYIGKLNEHEKNSVAKEIKVLKNISSENENIISFHNAWINHEKNTIVLITEIALSGTLSEYIKKIGTINMRVIKKWCKQILNALHFLHDKQIVHRDLKCSNIFYNSNNGNVIVGDFGLSNKKESNLHSVIGTPEYMAPEIYNEDYDEKVDIYAFGMCFLEMITKEIPYKNLTIGAIFKKVHAGDLPDNVNKIKNIKAKEVILSCLNKNPNIRPSALELIEHEFFNIIEEEDNNENLCLKCSSIPIDKKSIFEQINNNKKSIIEESVDDHINNFSTIEDKDEPDNSSKNSSNDSLSEVLTIEDTNCKSDVNVNKDDTTCDTSDKQNNVFQMILKDNSKIIQNTRRVTLLDDLITNDMITNSPHGDILQLVPNKPLIDLGKSNLTKSLDPLEQLETLEILETLERLEPLEPVKQMDLFDLNNQMQSIDSNKPMQPTNLNKQMVSAESFDIINKSDLVKSLDQPNYSPYIDFMKFPNNIRPLLNLENINKEISEREVIELDFEINTDTHENNDKYIERTDQTINQNT